MFGLNLLSTGELGVLASVVAALLTLNPSLGMTDQRRALVAIGVLIVGVLGQSNFSFTSWQEFAHLFLSASVYALVSYKMLLQPLVLPAVNNVLVTAGVKSPVQG